MTNVIKDIDASKIEMSIKLLKQYIEDSKIDPLISALETLQLDPYNESLLTQFLESFENIGILQGAVLTYAPYISVLVSGDIFGDDWD